MLDPQPLPNNCFICRFMAELERAEPPRHRIRATRHGRDGRRLPQLRQRPCGVEAKSAAGPSTTPRVRYFIVHLHRLLDPDHPGQK